MLRVLAVGACLGALAGASCVAGTARAAFPGANGLIAFQVNATTSDGSFIEHIYVVEPDGTGLRDLSTVSAPDGLVLDANPAWSPDGTKIAFDSNRGGSGAAHVFVMNANGTGVHQITGQPGSDPAWSPDGNRLAFVRDGNIFFRDLTTRLVRQLTHEVFPATAFAPTWSPVRPGLLAYASSGGSFGALNIFTVRLSDLLTHQLTFDGRSAEPDFSPDGSRIVFSSTRDGASSDGSDLYLMRADGTRPRRLYGGRRIPRGRGRAGGLAGRNAGRVRVGRPVRQRPDEPDRHRAGRHAAARQRLGHAQRRGLRHLPLLAAAALIATGMSAAPSEPDAGSEILVSSDCVKGIPDSLARSVGGPVSSSDRVARGPGAPQARSASASEVVTG